MKKIIKNRKGFTLIELLAVIVILGILMMVAIPAVTRVIANSRRDAYIDNAKKIIEAVRTEYAAGNIINSDGDDCPYPPTSTVMQVTLNPDDIKILLERGGEKSSFNRAYQTAYVLVQNNGGSTTDVGSYTYYIAVTDAGKNGIATPIAEGQLQRSNVVVGKSNTASVGSFTIADANKCTYKV